MCDTLIWQLEEETPWVRIKGSTVGSFYGNNNYTMVKGNVENEDNEVGCMERYVGCPCFPLEHITLHNIFKV